MKSKWVKASERLPIEHTADQTFYVRYTMSNGLMIHAQMYRSEIHGECEWLDTGIDEFYELRKECEAITAALKAARRYMRTHFNMTMTGFARALGVTPTQLSEWTSEPITSEPDLKETQEKPESFAWKFIEFNSRRAARGVGAARMEYGGSWFWCSLQDLKKNVRDFGSHPELLRAIEAYKGKP